MNHQARTLLFGHKNILQVDLGDLEDQKENLSTFLKSNLKVTVTVKQNKLIINPDTIAPKELQRIVTKFIYHRNLNGAHWVSTDGSTVKINKFKAASKKQEKRKSNAPRQTLTQSWGL